MRRTGAALPGLALLGVAAGLWLGRESAAAAASRALPTLGFALVSLLLQALVVLLAAAGLFRLRALLAAGGARVLARLDALDERLERLPALRGRAIRAALVGLTVGGVVALVLEGSEVGNALETRTLDLLVRLKFPERSQAELATGREVPSAVQQPDVVVLALDDETIAHLGWPLPRYHYARLIGAVAAAHPASLTFDVSLVDGSREHPEWDVQVGEASRAAGNVGFSFTVTRITSESKPVLTPAARAAFAANTIPWHVEARGLPEYSELIGGDAAPQSVVDPIAQNAAVLAMANVLLDGEDDVLRHSLLVARLGEQLLPSLSLRLAAVALHVPLAEVKVYPGSHLQLGSQRRVPIDRLGRTLVRYQGRHDTRGQGPFRYLSLWSLLRADSTLTLDGNPLGDDQRFILDESTRLEGGLDPTRLTAGARVRGVARYSPDPGRIVELAVAEPGSEPGFELIDEQLVRFTTTVGSAQANRRDVSALTGKHVLVGSTALAAADLRNSPLGELPGVEHHATMLANLLRDDFFNQTPLWANRLVVLAGALVAAGIGVGASAGVGLLATALLLLAMMISAFVLASSGVYTPAVAPSAAVALTYLTCMVLGARASRQARLRAERDREFVRSTFGRYLTEQVVEQLLDSPDGLKLGGQRDFVTIMMTDLRGFTSMCGTMEPEDVVRLLNHYLEAMTRIIARYGGTIDEFIGDAILVVFGAPLPLENAEKRAVACAIEMLNAMPVINAWNREQRLPQVEMGIGVHSGEVVLGNIGSELRAKYGIVGATINLTSRVESFTVGGQVLISEATRERCGELLTLGTTQVVSPKGVKGTLTIHEALAVGAPFNVELQSAGEQLVAPSAPLELRYATVKGKVVGELDQVAQVEAISELGMELKVNEPLAALSDLQLRVVQGGELKAGELYGKVLRAAVRPGVVYLRLTSVHPEVKPLLEQARAGARPVAVLEPAMVSR
ncbi:MAG: adenylate/guanylate cyclase domain-containing protein [Archangiaceae bacterium]|nr:adenylate/guanylate cyclase domain-containing protein [Archangiaceae bacterium]